MTTHPDPTDTIRPLLRNYARETRAIDQDLGVTAYLTQQYALLVLEEVRKHIQQECIDLLDALYGEYDQHPIAPHDGPFIKDGIRVAIRALTNTVPK